MPQCLPVDVVGVGLNATDTVVFLDRFPHRGEKLEYDTELLQPGGQVASAMVACARWGLRTRYVGKLGDDHAAQVHRQAFQEAGVEAQLICVQGVASPKSLILVDDGERTVLCRRDPRVVLQPEEIEREWVTSACALLVDGHDTFAAIRAAKWAREAGVPVVVDLDEAYAGVEDLLRFVDYLIVSRSFPGQLTGEPDLQKALQIAHSRFGCRLTAATLGEEGVLAWDGEVFTHTAAFQVDVVDTTGAGDVFHAGFLFGLLQGWPLRETLDFACAAAALNCTGQGARGRIGTREEVEELVRTGMRRKRHIERIDLIGPRL